VTRWAATLGVAAVLACTVHAQDAALVIAAPAAGDYVSDRVRIEVRIDPPALSRDVVAYAFYADGREVCRVEPPGAAVCDWDAGAVVRAHQIRVVATLVDGRRLVASRRTRALEVVESTAVRVVQVPAIVTDRRGVVVRGLTREVFALSEDGVPQAIQHFASEDAPLELVLALDVSASMADALSDLRRAVGQFVRQLPPHARLSLVAFNDEMFPVGQPTDSVERRLAILDRLQPFGGTALYDVMMRGLDDLARGSGRRALVVFTDGDDQASRATRAQVRAAAEASDVTVYFVALGRGQAVEPLREGMEELATLTGGRALHATRTAQLDARFGEVLAELAHQYLIGYAPSNAALDGGWRRIDVRLGRSDLRIRTRLGYRAPDR
jgi:Ca-activated chloride channel family protein